MSANQSVRTTVGDRVGLAALAVFAYVPLLLTNPGRVGGDTKAYLTIDPGQWLSKVAWLWSPAIGAGGVTHQNIGYLWPMGPWFWACDRLGLPMWVAQRLWLGTIIFSAGLGTWWLCRRIGLARLGLVAGFFYAFSPYLLQYSERMSVMLLPWAGLPWLVGLTVLAHRERTWRAPALFALVLGTVGGINASSILLIGFGPAAWLVYTVILPRAAETDVDDLRRRALRSLAVAGRIGLLSALTGAWWVAGLRNQGAFGLPILRYTETYETVARSSSATEVLRGFGHWYFYGGDQIGPWVEPSATYTQRPIVIAISFALPVLALIGLIVFRFRHRLYFGSLVVIGTLVAVGAYPYDDSSILGSLFKAVTGTDSGLALRSTPRAIPLLELGLALGFAAFAVGAGSFAVGWSTRHLGPQNNRSRHLIPTIATVAAVALVLINLRPLWDGTIAANRVSRPEAIPSYWLEAADAIDAEGSATRVLELPGSDFAAYRWGNTVDDLLPGLINRPSLARELIPSGTPQSAALLLALDHRYQDGTAEATALAPIAQLLGVGDILLRNDLEWERFNTPRPSRIWNELFRTPGLAPPAIFGDAFWNERSSGPLLDAIALSQPPTQQATAPLALFSVENPLPIVRTVSRSQPMIMAGDAEGLVDLAGQGLLNPQQAMFFAATFAQESDQLASLLNDGAVLVLTDTNAKQGLRWGTIRDNRGLVERADESLLRFDPSDNRLDVFPDQSTDDQTVALHTGARISATAYGNSVSFSAGERPYLAFDGDVETEWKVGAFDDVRGDRIVAELDTPLAIDHVSLRQSDTGNRWITKIRLSIGDRSLTSDLGPESRINNGQTISFPTTTADRVEIEILETNIGKVASYRDYSGVGFAEIEIPGLIVSESLRLPTALLQSVDDSIAHRLMIMTSRHRFDSTNATGAEPEATMQRVVELPTTRSYSLIGTARLDPQANDSAIRSLLGLDGVVAVDVSSSLPSDVLDRGRSALDDDASTWWTPAMTDTKSPWLQVTGPSEQSASAIAVRYASDGRHSVPSHITVYGDGKAVGSLEVPDIPDGEPGDTTTVTIPLSTPIAAKEWRVSVDGVHPRQSIPWLGGDPQVAPIAIAAIDGIPFTPEPAPAVLDTGCRSDFVSIDGSSVPTRAVAFSASLRSGQPLQLMSCSATTIGAGTALLSTAASKGSGLTVDRVVLGSEAGGSPLPVSLTSPAGAVDQSSYRSTIAPSETAVAVASERPDRIELNVTDAAAAAWLVFGQSYSSGWSAHSPELGDLGPPTLIDGYANGWQLPKFAGTARITLTWTPQNVVWIGVIVSIAGVILCAVLLLAPPLRRRRSALAESSLNDPDNRFGIDPPSARVPSAANLRLPILGALVSFGFALFILPEWRLLIASIIGALTFVVLRTGRWTRSFALTAPAALALAGLYSAAREWRGRYPFYAWPWVTSAVNFLGVTSCAVLGAWILIEALRSEDCSDSSPSEPPAEQ